MDNKKMQEPGKPGAQENQEAFGFTRWVGLIGGGSVFVLMLTFDPPAGLEMAGWRTASVAILMATWWITEVIPISATALLPLILFPLFGISDIGTTAQPYAHPMIFLFMGGFIIAIAMQRWNLHRRIALHIISLIGSKPRNIIMGFMFSTALMSMWVSNVAATMMMLPIALPIIELCRKMDLSAEGPHAFRYFSLSLMLAIAYSASVGGLGTVIGTPTNGVLVVFVEQAYGVGISFVDWFKIGLPVVILGLPVVYITLVNIVYPVRFKSLPGGPEYLKQEKKSLGTITRPELLVAAIFTIVALLWITRPLLSDFIPGLSDAGVAIFGALLLFLIPSRLTGGSMLMGWKDAEKLPWGVLILFGGGLSLAGAIHTTGLAEWIGGYMGILGGLPVWAILFIVALTIIMFTELASNSATAAAFLPIIGSVAIGLGLDPLLLAIPVGVVASCAFMLPAATPPNAIIYGSGVVTIPEMVKAGLYLNIFFAVLITLITYFLFPVLLGIDMSYVP